VDDAFGPFHLPKSWSPCRGIENLTRWRESLSLSLPPCPPHESKLECPHSYIFQRGIAMFCHHGLGNSTTLWTEGAQRQRKICIIDLPPLLQIQWLFQGPSACSTLSIRGLPIKQNRCLFMHSLSSVVGRSRYSCGS
jgi:hypothetical protein